jgi:hypothetical protein
VGVVAALVDARRAGTFAPGDSLTLSASAEEITVVEP